MQICIPRFVGVAKGLRFLEAFIFLENWKRCTNIMFVLIVVQNLFAWIIGDKAEKVDLSK